MTNATIRRTLGFAAMLGIGVATAGSAHAGKCPAAQMRPDGTGQKMSTAPAKSVSDSVLSSIDLGKEPGATAPDRLLRLRKLEIKPGGVVPWHEHKHRPAIIYILQGEITEYASTCAVPIVHRGGDVATETGATSHWWKNTGAQTVVLLSADFFPTEDHDHHMM